MLLDVNLDNESVSLDIENPFNPDLDAIMVKIEGLAASKKIALNGTDIKGLIPKMIRGIAGCKSGCPANALSFVEQGFKNFELKYIEGGILLAKASIENGKLLQIKMFPDF